jgi:predicted  nucleic acid-binding Zn-ribbon protein
MRLFQKEEILKGRKDQTRELTLKNERLATSLRKLLNLQKDIEFDADKAKKVKDYQVWCEDLQTKMSKELGNLNAYKKLVEERKEEYYNLVAKKDEIEDGIITLKEELEKLELQVVLKKQILQKANAII